VHTISVSDVVFIDLCNSIKYIAPRRFYFIHHIGSVSVVSSLIICLKDPLPSYFSENGGRDM
jgi:hypothetical protein